MKQCLIIISIFLLWPLNYTVAQEDLKKENKSRQQKYATMENGTYLQPKAYRLLKTLDRVSLENYNRQITKKVLDIAEPKVHKVVDSIVSYSEYDVPIRIYYPSKESLDSSPSVILYIHGGGFILGSIDQYDMAVKKLAKTTNCIVVSVDYRLAPEHPFPAALNDVSAVLEWLSEHCTELGGNENGICVMGDSAGGNLATVLCLRYRNHSSKPIACQVLYYPSTTFIETEFPSRLHFFRDSTRTYLLKEEFVHRAKAEYLGGFSDESHPYLSPLEANLSSVPPALIITAQCDPLRDEGRLYAEQLIKEGNIVEYHEYPGLIHGFLNFYMIFRESKESMLEVKDFLSEHCE